VDVDQHRGRHSDRHANAFERLKNGRFFVIKIAQMNQVGIFQKGLRFVGVAGVDIDGDHGEFIAAELVLKSVQGRHFRPAGHTPGRP
jgi:hypothetical protein